MPKDLFLKSYNAIKALATQRIQIEYDSIPHQFNNVPLKKILNWIRVETSILFKPARPWGWPTHVMIEPTNYCNLKCTLCPVNNGMDRSKGYMDFNSIKKVIDEIGDYLFFVFLWDWGEPFLNSSIYEMISYVKRRGIRAVSCTNGHPFANVDNVDKVIHSGLDTLIVAMDGISQETYQRYRQGGNLESVLQGIRTIVARKRSLNSKTPLINLRFIVMKHNEHEIPGLKDLAKSLGVDALTFMTLNPYIDDVYSESKSIKNVKDNEFLPKDYSYRRFAYAEDGESRIRLKNNPCKHLWNNPVIHWNGTVCPCASDYNGKYTLGNLKKDTFEGIWFGDPYRQIRSQFHTNCGKLSLCRECSYTYKGGDLGCEAIADAFFFNTTDHE